MEAAEVANILRDFRSIKLNPEQRAFVDRARDAFESSGGVPLRTRLALRRIASYYSKQFAELSMSRERARITNGLRHVGMTRGDAEAVRERRIRDEKVLRSDFGI